MPQPSDDFHDRLARVEDAVQRFEFVHLVKTDATTNGLGMLFAQQKRVQEDIAGFRAEVTAEFESLRTDVTVELATLKGEVADIKTTLAEILRRLSS